MSSDSGEFELIMVIVDFGLGSKVLKMAVRNGVNSGTVFLGKGTMQNRLNQLLGLDETRKEIVIMQSPKAVVEDIAVLLVTEFNLKKPNQGIAFTMPLSAILEYGRNDYAYNDLEGENMPMYTSIITVVDKGKAELVMDAAVDAGARGGTIINGRGSGQYETGKLFNIDIEPEKEIVLILAKASEAEKITLSIRDRLGIGTEENGFVFCQSVNRAYGIY